MKLARTLFILLLMSLQGVAQSNSCPLRPILVKNMASRISVDLQNISGKPVASYTVALTFSDVNGHAHAFPHEFTDTVKLKQHGKRTAVWNSPSANQFLFPLAKAYLTEATFTDGTDWTDDGTKSCAVTSVQE